MSVIVSQERFGVSSITDAAISYPPTHESKALIEGSAVVIFPNPQGYGGDGLGLRIVGRPYIIVARQNISQVGYDWYWAFITNGIPTLVYVEAYSMRDGTWNPYQATMHLPTITNVGVPDTTVRVRNFECRFTNMIQQDRA